MRRGVVHPGMFVVVVVAGWLFGPDVVRTVDGKRCLVGRGATMLEVRTACGAPLKTGSQHKRVEWSWSGPRACSAPADVYPAEVVLYGCDSRVAEVKSRPADGVLEDVPW